MRPPFWMLPYFALHMSDQMVNHAVKCLESRHLTAWLTIWSGMYYAHLRVVYIVHMSLLWITEVTTTPLFSASSSMQYGCPMWLSNSEIMVAITPSHQSCIETLDVVLQSVFRAGEIIAFNRVEQKAGPFFLFFSDWNLMDAHTVMMKYKYNILQSYSFSYFIIHTVCDVIFAIKSSRGYRHTLSRLSRDDRTLFRASWRGIKCTKCYVRNDIEITCNESNKKLISILQTLNISY